MEMANQGIFALQDSEGVALTYHLTDEVDLPTKYVKIMELARLLDSNDTFEIVIGGSPGGFLSGARALTTIQDTTEATTVAVVIDNIASAATMVAVNADELIMTDGASMMIHTASYGTGGSTPNIKSQVDFMTDEVGRTMSKYYKHFITKKELKYVLSGNELWLTGEDCSERFANVVAKRQKQAEKESILHLKDQRETLVAQLESVDAILKEHS